jgi:hypothetical protein
MVVEPSLAFGSVQRVTNSSCLKFNNQSATVNLLKKLASQKCATICELVSQTI